MVLMFIKCIALLHREKKNSGNFWALCFLSTLYILSDYILRIKLQRNLHRYFAASGYWDCNSETVLNIEDIGS